ncbi:glycosyltransferase, partial [Psychrobacter sp. CAL495-MNA-CIBAN-0180]|uniref:glycosyltransferase n=1 Tax=Psychrobacter sp. CAL495-MNA-CIBAN-0180 TaxID=3140454 RepID=UPI0033302343
MLFTDRDMDRLADLPDSEIEDLRLWALERVLARHTYRNRWQEMLSAIGLAFRPEDEGITIACPVASAEDARGAINFCMQRGLNPPE